MPSKEILQKREDLKRMLDSKECKPLLDIYLDWIGSHIRTTFHRSVNPPFWVSAVVPAFAILASSIILSFVLCEFSRNPLRPERLPSEIALVMWVFLGTIILKIQLDTTYRIWRTKLVDAVETTHDLDSIRDWFESICNVKRQFTFGLIGGLLFGAYAVLYVCRVRGGFIGAGPIVLDFLVCILVATGLYYVIYFLVLIIQLRSYHFDLFLVNPRRGEALHQLSTLLFSYVWGTALFVAAITLVLGAYAVMNAINVFILIGIGWGPTIIAFTLSIVSLSSIISTKKWEILTELQGRIECLLNRQNRPEKETIEAASRLLDFHDRIWETENSMFGTSSLATITKSLMLPLLTFALGKALEMLFA